MSAESLKRDAEELSRLAGLTENENVKRIIQVEAAKLQEIAERDKKAAAVAEQKNFPSATYSIKIVNYAWDQTDKYLKIYVSFKDVQNFPVENIVPVFDKKNLELQISTLDKKTHALTIKGLLNAIIPSESYHKIKTDMVVLFLRKEKNNHWACVTESEKKAKEPKLPQMGGEEDPSQNLMNIMKQMYQEGDDDMKRTIAKAWTEARDKQPPEM